ncbi:protein kinase domain-containing protein, partial [Streptococcus agalactiae]
MELVEGSPLNSEIELLRPRRIAADILEALAALHRRGVTHGDVSPANILVSEGGRATLIDPDLSNERKGTPSYVPSEPDT